MLRVLVDTSAWLDLVKDYRQQPVLGALEHLVRRREAEIILPSLVLEEFNRNKDRVAADSSRSLASTFRRVWEAVDQFGHEDTKTGLLRQLSEVEHRIGTLGGATNESIGRVEALFVGTPVIETSAEAKLRATERAIHKRAPFHKPKNSMADALLIETYADAVAANGNGDQFAFVTHNIHDFSATGSDNRLPHPDIADLFDGARSSYSISLASTLSEVAPDWLEDFKFEFEFYEEPRRLSEIMAAIDVVWDQVWYNRHWNRRIAIEEGRTQLVDRETFPPENPLNRPIERGLWQMALEAAKRVEERRGLDNLGPWTDFEWGMINGKLSALRWVLGDEWDNLDT